MNAGGQIAPPISVRKKNRITSIHGSIIFHNDTFSNASREALTSNKAYLSLYS